jgi:hypothetical protein
MAGILMSKGSEEEYFWERETLAMTGARAQRSAQMPTGVEAISTLDPVWYVPVERRRDAPTGKRE